jgi:Flp pilus assembly protein TadG
MTLPPVPHPLRPPTPTRRGKAHPTTWMRRPPCRSPRPAGRLGPRDRGSLMLLFIPLAVAVLLFAGLVADGGALLAARERAADIARQAARAGANALSATSLRTADPNDLTLNPAAARTAADQVLQSAALTGDITITGDTVTVTAHASQPTAVLTLIGVSRLTATVTASARPLPA